MPLHVGAGSSAIQYKGPFATDPAGDSSGDLIFDTQSAIDLESLIGKFGFGNLGGSGQ